jgi:hypothetical protein
MSETYRIIRYYQRRELRPRTIRRGLTLEEAMAHCEDPETSSTTCTKPHNRARTRRLGGWFDGFTAER